MIDWPLRECCGNADTDEGGGSFISGYGACCILRMFRVGPFGCRTCVKLQKLIVNGVATLHLLRSSVCSP